MTVTVSEAEYEVLEKLSRLGPGRYTTKELADLTGIERSRLEPLVRLLASKGLLRVRERERLEYRATEEAVAYARGRFPEEELVSLLEEAGGSLPVGELKQRMGGSFRIALANAIRKNWVRVEAGRAVLVSKGSCDAERRVIEAVLHGAEPGDKRVVEELKRRGLLKVTRRRETVVEIPEDVGRLLSSVRVEAGALTHQDLVTGRWRRLRLRPYDVTANPPRRVPGRLHFFVEFLYHIRDVLRELGFHELPGGSVVVSEFWNYDVLFQPQFHPARFPTDTFYVEAEAGVDADRDMVERVRRAHEKGVAGSIGWGYTWSLEKAANKILRSHTTAVTIRALASMKPKPPFRYYVLGRVYRVEKPDPRHLVEFHQFDGIMSEDGASFASLLGIIAEIFDRLGIRRYKFRPAYFPFTEPSAEVYVRIGDEWIEAGGCGMFRPEVLASAGYGYGDVAAWGIGVERLMASLYGLRDIRDLYSIDADRLSSIPLRWWIYAGLEV